MPDAPRNQPARSGASPVGTWLDHHVYSVLASLGRLFKKPWSAALTIGVMAVALALPLGLWLVLDNVSRLGGSIDASREISVFLRQDVDDARAQALAGELRGRGDVDSIVHRSPDEGLAELRERGEFGDTIDVLGENPLPHVLIVTPGGDEMLLAESLRMLPETELVQHDAQWRERLDGWLRFGGRVVWVLAALLAIGVLLVVGNTVRLDIQSRREELGVLQLLGATDGFIRRPFLYLGAWYGLGAGAVALGLLAIAGRALQPPLAELASSYGAAFALRGFGPPGVLAVLGVAALLGWLGGGIVTGHFLRQTRPTET